MIRRLPRLHACAAAFGVCAGLRKLEDVVDGDADLSRGPDSSEEHQAVCRQSDKKRPNGALTGGLWLCDRGATRKSSALPTLFASGLFVKRASFNLESHRRILPIGSQVAHKATGLLRPLTRKRKAQGGTMENGLRSTRREDRKTVASTGSLKRPFTERLAGLTPVPPDRKRRDRAQGDANSSADMASRGGHFPGDGSMSN
jgi:hypothetical protein